MKKKVIAAVVAVLVLALAIIVASWFAYQNSPDVKAAKEAQLRAEISSIETKIANFCDEGNVDGAIQLTEQVCADKRFEQFHANFFAQKVNLFLSVSNTTEATACVLDAWKNNRSFAEAAFGQIYNFYKENDKNAEIQAWTDTLLALEPPLPEQFLGQVYGWKAITAIRDGDIETAKKIVELMGTKISKEMASEVLSYVISRALQEDKLDEAEGLIAFVEKSATYSDKFFANIFTHIRAWIAIAKKDWDGTLEYLNKAIETFPDDRLARLSREVFNAFDRNDQVVKMETAAERIIRKSKAFIRSSLTAARYWINSCVKNKPDQLPERLNFLVESEMPGERVCMFFEDKFYQVSTNNVTMRKMCEFGRKLVEKYPSDTNTVNNMTLKILDGAFIVGDYDSAIAMIERGIPGKDPTWHKLTLPKVKAHAALDRAMKECDEAKRVAGLGDAVKYFRQFMDAWNQCDKEEEVDPITGISYSKEWILGHNAGRIGKILLQINRGDAAMKAFNEAREYYRAALKKAEKDAEALKLLKPEAAAYGVK